MPKVLPPGESRAVDIAVVDPENRLLLITRRDTGEWALPGGFVEDGESDVDAMVRELAEETGVEAAGRDLTVISPRFRVEDPRNRPDAWISTVVGLYRTDVRPHAQAGSDAKQVDWFELDRFDLLDADVVFLTGVGMYACHRPAIDAVYRAVFR